MRWTLHALTQSRNLRQLTNSTSIYRKRQRNTRNQRALLSTLETLEHRRLLSGGNVTVTYASGALTVAGDNHNDSFSVTENASGGTVTVASTAKGTTINGFSSPYTSPGPVSSIGITMQGTTADTADNVKLAGPSSTQGVKSVTVAVTGNAALTFAASSVHNSGTFSLTTGAWLSASLDSSTFNLLSITQTGSCCAVVELGSDVISGKVTVTEANGNNDSITADNDGFGATTFTQGTGSGDSVAVDPSKVLNLSITQGNGNGDSIDINTLSVSNTSWGVTTTQGTGIGDSATITAVTGYGTINNPDDIPSISVTQNDVYLTNGLVGDTASVSNSDVPGYIAISQGGSNLDSASVTNSTAYFWWISIGQGSGNSDSASISGVTAGDYVTISQGDGGISLPLFTVGDSASIMNIIAGGNVATTQGNGAGDEAVIDPTNAGGDVSIAQGNGDGDYAAVEETAIIQGNLVISQGNGAADQIYVYFVAVIGSVTIVSGDGAGDDIWAEGINDAFGGITVTMGDGAADSCTVIDSLVVSGNISSSQGNGSGDFADIETCQDYTGSLSNTQGDGNGDVAEMLDDQAGYIYYSGPYPIDVAGNATITQGNGYADLADLDDGNAVNNVNITQGDSAAYPGCQPGMGDEIDINDTAVTSDIAIVQGDSNAVGNYVVNIAATSAVTGYGGTGNLVGATSIYQYGANNTVNLGGADNPSGTDFGTDNLDIYTGAGGGGFVSAINTYCEDGSAYGNDYVIDGGGTGNTYDDLGNNYGITISANYNYESGV